MKQYCYQACQTAETECEQPGCRSPSDTCSISALVKKPPGGTTIVFTLAPVGLKHHIPSLQSIFSNEISQILKDKFGNIVCFFSQSHKIDQHPLLHQIVSLIPSESNVHHPAVVHTTPPNGCWLVCLHGDCCQKNPGSLTYPLSHVCCSLPPYAVDCH